MEARANAGEPRHLGLDSCSTVVVILMATDPVAIVDILTASYGYSSCCSSRYYIVTLCSTVHVSKGLGIRVEGSSPGSQTPALPVGSSAGISVQVRENGLGIPEFWGFAGHG